MAFEHRLTHNLSVPDEEGRQLVINFVEWKPFTITKQSCLTPREEIPPAFRGRERVQLTGDHLSAYPGS